MLFDDYGFPACPGARKAVDEFFRDRPEAPVVLATGQAVVIKLSQPKNPCKNPGSAGASPAPLLSS
jgi:hypothetical protein